MAKFIFFLLIPLVSCSQKTSEKSSYLSINKESFENFNDSNPINHKVIREQNDQLVIEVFNPEDLIAISSYNHEQKGICAGYTSFDTLNDALYSMDNSRIEEGVYGILSNYEITQSSLVHNLILRVNQDNIAKTILKLSSFFSRYYQNSSAIEANEWLLKKWRYLTRKQPNAQVFQFNHEWLQPSVVAKIIGRSDETIVIGGHIDSINSSNRSNHSPGEDDDASGIATMTEVLRVLMESDYVPEKTLLFVAYAAEEVGLKGSYDFVSYIRQLNSNIIGVLQLDMTLYRSPNAASEIYLITSETNQAQNNFLKSLGEEYLPGVTIGQAPLPSGAGSDHSSWANGGYPASFPFETNPSQLNRNIHTTQDTLRAIGNSAAHTVNFAKLAISFLVEKDQ
jgi:leucyl aminopeptidase